MVEIPKCVDGLLDEDRGIIHSPADPDPRAQQTRVFNSLLHFLHQQGGRGQEGECGIHFLHSFLSYLVIWALRLHSHEGTWLIKSNVCPVSISHRC